VVVVFVLNLVFNHWWPNLPRREGVVEMAIEHGAVAPAHTEERTAEDAESGRH
jgi:hypothetical protein